MTKVSGVWLDSKKAVIVSIYGSKGQIKTIQSGIESRERQSGEGKRFGRFANQFLSFEKTKQRKNLRKEKLFFKNIIDSVKKAEKLVLFGPASTKNRLEKEIQSNKTLRMEFEGSHDCDSMTDNQIIAWVKDFFKISSE